MALVVFLRGVNVGGHRTFRPTVLAKKLRAFDVVSIGAAGTFVVRRPGSRAKFRAALLGKLPFDAHVAICDGRDLLRLAKRKPRRTKHGIVGFVSIVPKKRRRVASIALPSRKKWLVRVLSTHDRFVIGEYRRHMKTITYLGELDALFGGRATTRNWNTIQSIADVLRAKERT